MPFINVAGQKRSRSNPKPLLLWRSNKIPRLDVFDGNGSQQSAESSLSTIPSHSRPGLKAKLKRGGSHIKTLLGLGSRQDTLINDQEEGIMTRMTTRASQNSLRSMTTSSLLRPLKLTLTGGAMDRDRDFTGDLPATLHEMDPMVPGLKHRLSHRIHDVFALPTVVHRSDLKARPSIQAVRETFETSTVDSVGSLLGQKSTPATSNETPPNSSSSVLHHESLSPVEPSKALTVFEEHGRLSPISETTVPNAPSILTVEATANAKIFLETHFNAIYNGDRPRSIRLRELEQKLEAFNVPLEIRLRAQKAFVRHETELLRKQRVLKSSPTDSRVSKGISIAGYEIIRVLGKGSFGVVRLVKELPSTTSTVESRPCTPTSSTKSSRVDLSSLRASAREVFSPLTSSRKRSNGSVQKQVYAMKVIRKSDMIRNSQEGHLRAERDFLVSSEGCHWIIPLIASFQDHRHLYLVMDFCIGGDFLGLLIRKNTLSEDVTRWYIAEMILCIEEAHRLKWIHRDVKPDNFLIGADGHLKISDFGLAFDGEWAHDQQYYHKHRHNLVERLGITVGGDSTDVKEAKEKDENGEATGKMRDIIGMSLINGADLPVYDNAALGGKIGGFLSGKPTWRERAASSADGELILEWRNRERRRKLARSVVGTSQYMAPEVIRGDLYDGRCDWWSVGIILYECLYGYTPFACDNRQDTKARILKHRSTLKFPDQPQGQTPISYEAIELMLRMLQEKEKRLCTKRYLLNDYTRKMTNGRSVRVQADKASKNYSGHFVYADDAEDIKAHIFFRGISWHDLHLRKPPFVPKVKSPEDTKYFDDDESCSISDISESSEDAAPHIGVEAATVVASDSGSEPRQEVDENALEACQHAGERATGSRQHQQEDQKIVPSNALPAHKVAEIMASDEGRVKLQDPLIAPSPPSVQQQVDGPLSGPGQGEIAYQAVKREQKKKDKKRPRDKILRDADCSKTAMEMRKRGAFLGYGYHRSKGVDEAIRGALMEVGNEVR